MPASKRVAKYPTAFVNLYSRFAALDMAHAPGREKPFHIPFPSKNKAVAYRHQLHAFGRAMQQDREFLNRPDAMSMIEAHDRREVVLRDGANGAGTELIIRLRSESEASVIAHTAIEEYFNQLGAPAVAPGGHRAAQADGSADPVVVPEAHTHGVSPPEPAPLTVERINRMNRAELGALFNPLLFTPYGKPKDEVEAAAKERFAYLAINSD